MTTNGVTQIEMETMHAICNISRELRENNELLKKRNELLEKQNEILERQVNELEYLKYLR